MVYGVFNLIKRKTRMCFRYKTVLMCCLLLLFVCSYLQINLLNSVSTIKNGLLDQEHNREIIIDIYNTDVNIFSIQTTNIIDNRLIRKHVEGGMKTFRKKVNEDRGDKDIPTTRSRYIRFNKSYNSDGGIINKFNEGSARSSLPQPEPVNCTFLRHRYFPLCLDKVNYLKSFWNRDKCFYDTHKVNGSQCSIYHYFTKIEPFCIGEQKIYRRNELALAVPNLDVKGILHLFENDTYSWMRRRAISMWPSWVADDKTFSLTRSKYKKKNVVALIGSLTVNSWLVEWAGKGGPLGELIQWTDLIISLYILGYDVTVAKDPSELKNIKKGNENNCATGKNEGMIDVIYTDVAGMIMMKERFGESSFSKYRCMLRILDSFGTYPEFNFPQYPYKVPGGRSGWGNHNLILTQFLTLYPHTHDNSFLGFVITNVTKSSSTASNKKDRALLYAKHASYIRNHERYIQIVSEYFEIHATCINNYQLPSYIHNHGPVSREKVQELLLGSKVFIGVGFPYEGPGPMEAMANGAAYLQPKFDIPVNKLNNNFFGGKPTLRKLTSQNPYMEEFVGEPYSYTINVTDESLLRKTLKQIKNAKPLSGRIPKEFTIEGILERVHVFTDHMDYCNPYTPRWPPVDNLQVYFSLVGESCKDTCMSRGLVCERTYFNEINTAIFIEKYGKVKCTVTKLVYLLHAPSMDSLTKICYIQDHEQMFSCMHEKKGMKRLCPCRDYEIEQSAICKNCL